MGIANEIELSVAGARILTLAEFTDERGTLLELFRTDWNVAPVPLQWNMVRSAPNSLRGVHVHLGHEDYLFVIAGCMHLGLYDIRPDSSTRGASTLARITEEDRSVAVVPRGVLHGFAFVEPTTYVYGLTACWTPADDTGCLWSDPDLGIDWPLRDPLLSSRDRGAPSLADLKQRLATLREAP